MQLHGDWKVSHLPSLAVFLSAVLTGGLRVAGVFIESPCNGVTGAAVTEVPEGRGGVEGPAAPGAGAGG